MARALRVRRPAWRCPVAVRGHDRKAIFRRQSRPPCQLQRRPSTPAQAIPVIIANLTPQDVTPPPKSPAPRKADAAVLQFRLHQKRIFEDRRGILILH